jgi:hypothetical protein
LLVLLACDTAWDKILAATSSMDDMTIQLREELYEYTVMEVKMMVHLMKDF